MKQIEFESKLLKLVKVTSLAYSKVPASKSKFRINAVYVHYNSLCHLELGDHCMEKQLEYYKERNNASK